MQNINSPIVSPNGMLGGYQTPPNPYLSNNGNMISIANQGYNTQYPFNTNGGYYSHNYTMYNPYLAQQQRQAEEARRMQMLRESSDIMKMVSRKVNRSMGREISDERLRDLYDPEEIRMSEDNMEIRNSNRLRSVDQYNNYQGFVYQNPLYLAMGRVQENNQKKLSPNMSLYEFLAIGGELISDSIKDDVIKSQKNINNLYNRSDYQKLIELRSKNNGFGGTFNPNANIDDMTISLPEKIKNEYEARKAAFMEKIINGGRR